MSEFVIKAQELKKTYGTFDAVKGVTFTIEKGDFYGFLGPNGAGKTTVMRIISCFLKPTSGSVTVLGMDVTKRPSDIKARIGMVAQENTMDPDISVLDNLVIYANYYGISRKKSLPRALELLEFVNLSDWSKSKIRELSGGMLRRLQIARSLVNAPEILILDEPTTGLDPHSRQDLWGKLRELRETTGITILLTTHYMEEAEKLCSTVAIMDRGEIVTIDSPEKLMNAHGGNLEDVYLKLTGKPLKD